MLILQIINHSFSLIGYKYGLVHDNSWSRDQPISSEGHGLIPLHLLMRDFCCMLQRTSACAGTLYYLSRIFFAKGYYTGGKRKSIIKSPHFLYLFYKKVHLTFITNKLECYTHKALFLIEVHVHLSTLVTTFSIGFSLLFAF